MGTTSEPGQAPGWLVFNDRPRQWEIVIRKHSRTSVVSPVGNTAAGTTSSSHTGR